MSQDHVKELLKARKQIVGGTHGFICNALLNEHRSYNPAARQITDQIKADLRGCETLDTWLNVHHGLSWRQLGAGGSSKMRATRLAWIDALIEYWKDK